MIYLDNAATSGKKPESVYAAMDNAIRNCSGNPGRSGHAVSLAAGRIVEEARVSCAQLLHAEDASEISFSWNTTGALNTAIYGISSPGTHIITSSLEHNSVSRPLEHLKSLGAELTVLSASVDRGVDPDDVRKAIRSNTSLVVMTHISNVTGTVNDIRAIGAVCREAGVPFLVDAAQSIGTRPIDVTKDNIDMLAFPGHKGLLGPQGTGGLYIRKGLDVSPLTRGGTGSFSESPEQPLRMPDRLESGTLNVPGLAGLAEGIRFILATGEEQIRKREDELRRMLYSGLSEIPGVRLYSPQPDCDSGGVLSFAMDGTDPAEIAMILDSGFDIAVRSGLHCAPYAHRMLGTIDSGGTVRVSPNWFTQDEEIVSFIEAITAIREEN